MILLSIIKKLDYFGPTVQFTIRNEGNFKTFFGGIVTIIYAIIYVLVLYSFIGEFYNKENPNVMTSTNFFLGRQKEYKVSNDNFLFSFSIHEIILKFLNLTSDDITFKAYINTIDENSFSIKPIRSEVPLLKCLDLLNSSSILTNPNSFLFEKIERDYCTNFSQNETFVLKPNNPPYQYEDFSFVVTLNPNKDVCSKIDQLKNNDDQIISIYPKFLTSSFDPSNYEKPFFDLMYEFYDTLDLKKVKLDNFDFDYNLLKNDDGFLFSNENEISRFSISKEKIHIPKFTNQTSFDYNELENYCRNKDPDYLINQKNILLQIDFYVNWIYYVEYFRTYKKVQDFLGNVNGVMEVFNKIIFLLIYFYSNYRFDYFLINSNVNVRDACNNNDISKSKIPKFEDIELSKLKSFRTKVSNDRSSNFFQMQGKLNQNLASSSAIITPNPNNIEKSSRIGINNIYRSDLSQIDINKSGSIVSKNLKNYNNYYDNFNNKTNNNSNNKNDNNNNDSNRESNKLKYQSETGKKENEIVEKINKLMEPKKNFFTPNLINYYLCCDRICKMGKKRLLQVKLFSFFSEKINKKLDILYYFKLIKKVKNLQYLFFGKKEQHMFYDILNTHLYPLKLQDACDEKFFLPKEKNKKENLIEYYNGIYKDSSESDRKINEKLVEKLNQII